MSSGFKEAASRGWVVLTRDQRIRTRPNEIEVIRAVGARVVVVTGRDMSGSDIAALLTRKLKAIEGAVKAFPSVNVLAITRTGKIARPLSKRKK